MGGYTKKVEGGYWEHKCGICGKIWYTLNKEPKVCANLKCTNRTRWKEGKKRN